MQNQQRQEIYLRDRTRLTSAQRRRIAKHAHGELAQLSRATRRAGHRQVLRAEAQRRFAIRGLFSRRYAA